MCDCACRAVQTLHADQRCSDSSFFESDSSPDPTGRNPDPNPVCNTTMKPNPEKILLTYLTNQCATIPNLCF